MSQKEQMIFVRDAIKKETKLAKEATDARSREIHMENIKELIKALHGMEGKIELEAIKIDKNPLEIQTFLSGPKVYAWDFQGYNITLNPDNSIEVNISNRDGSMIGKMGDYIVKDPECGFLICNKDQFDEKYKKLNIEIKGEEEKEREEDAADEY